MRQLWLILLCRQMVSEINWEYLVKYKEKWVFRPLCHIPAGTVVIPS